MSNASKNAARPAQQPTLRVLILEDSEDAVLVVLCELQKAAYRVIHRQVQTCKEMELALDSEPWDVIVADYTMPGFSGLDGLRLLHSKQLDIPFLILSASIDEELAVSLMKAGAHDYVMKSNMRRLLPAIEREVREASERRQRRQIELRNEALSRLGRDLSSAARAEGAARHLAGLADELFGWDACAIDLYSREENRLWPLLRVDTIQGARTEAVLTPAGIHHDIDPAAESVLREDPPAPGSPEPGGTPSAGASTLTVPIRHAGAVIGLISIQSRAAGSYRQEDLDFLQSLADHCGSAFERIHAAEALRESEERFRTLSETLPIGIFQTNGEGFCSYNNARWRAISGLTAEQSAGFGWTMAIHPEDRAAVLLKWHKALAGDSEWSADYRIKTAGGQCRWVRSMATAVMAQGQKSGFVVTVEDTTEQKRVEKQNAVLSRLSQHLSSAASASEAAGFIGQAADELFGWDAFDLFLYSAGDNSMSPVLSLDTQDGKRVVTTRPTNSAPTPAARRVMESGGQLALVPPAPELTWAADRARPSPLASVMHVPIRERTQVIGVLSVQSRATNAYAAEDLRMLQTIADHCGGAMERLRAEAALKNSERLFHSVWENSVDGMRLTDEDGIMVAINDAFCRLVGIGRDELEGRPFTATYDENDGPEAALREFRARFRTGEIDRMTRRRACFRSGKTLDVEETNSFVELNGRRLVLGLLRDITEQRRLEEELRQSQKMDSIGQLAGGIAHDFNNLLTVIQGHASLLSSEEGLSEYLLDSIRQISVAAERSSHLTRQLLTFGRRQVTQPRNLDVNDTVSSMTNMLCRILGENIRLRVECAPSLPVIHADQGMMEQIIMNLAINARDAMPKGGELKIATDSLTVDPAYRLQNPDAGLGPAVCLRFSDTGSGIPASILPRIFEPFFTTKDVGKGTGLGLATVYGIVKQHHGWIKVSSTVNEGSVFEIYIPGRQIEGRPSDDRSVETELFGGTETILIVEDEALLRELVHYILERHGYRVLHAPSGVAALHVWREHRHEIDLLLTDMIMPEGMTGRELAEKLLEEEPELKVIFTSGYSAEVLGKDLVLSEGINFLQKPYPPRRLVQAVRECLDGDTEGAVLRQMRRPEEPPGGGTA